MLDLLLPQHCLGCRRPGMQVCTQCRTNLPRIVGPLCARCGAPTAWPVRRCRECTGRRLAFASARAAVAYDEPVRRIVASWKERGLRRLATLAAEIVTEVVDPPRGDAIVPIPPDRDRRLRRGHHTAEDLSRELALRWSVPHAQLLVRPRASPRQRGLDEIQRRRNVRGAFAAAASPAHIVLVDDVYTTGATVGAAASELRKAGARSVTVVTFARAIRMR